MNFGDKTQKTGCWLYLALRQRSDLCVLAQKVNADADIRSACKQAKHFTPAWRSKVDCVLLEILILRKKDWKHYLVVKKNKLMLVGILCRRPEILLLDEPTNHLDLNNKIFLENILKDYKGCLLLVSRDKTLTKNVCNSSLTIEKGEIKKN